MRENLEAAAAYCADLEARGYQATVRLAAYGFEVAVSRNFHTSRRRVTFQDATFEHDNILIKCLENCAEHCPVARFETA